MLNSFYILHKSNNTKFFIKLSQINYFLCTTETVGV